MSATQKQTKTAATLPATSGRWAPITRGKTAPRVVAWIEVFATAGGDWVTIPGHSRYYTAA